jgi:hypothetical protein
MGMEARFATSMVTTNSDGSICPTCRLPMSRTAKRSSRYRIIVRVNDKIKKTLTSGLSFPGMGDFIIFDLEGILW